MYVGFSGCVLFAWVFREARRREALLWPLAIRIDVLAGGVLAAAGRAGFGTHQAMSSRYQTISMPFWIGVVLFFAVLLVSELDLRTVNAEKRRAVRSRLAPILVYRLAACSPPRRW